MIDFGNVGMEGFSIILFLGAMFAGMLGSLTGLGGGVVVIPLLTLGFGVDMRYAIGAALITSIATSSGAAAAYIKERFTNTRLGMFLEVATTTGAVVGAMVAMYLPTNYIAILFGFVLIFSGVMSVRKKNTLPDGELKADAWATKLKLNSSFPDKNGEVQYSVQNVAGGYALMTLAGILSGILGIGSGALKVLAMDTMMKIPFKVSTTTSNFMVGVTAAASAVIYWQRGYIAPGLAFPIVSGVLLGAFFGAKILMKANVQTLRMIFCAVITVIAIQMIYNGFVGRI